jgi:SAM-dependent methyltransferase
MIWRDAPSEGEMPFREVSGKAAFTALYHERLQQIESAKRFETNLLHDSRIGDDGYKAYCAVCNGDFPMSIARGEDPENTNWRETLTCQCELNSRQRAAFHFLVQRSKPLSSLDIYVCEQTTSFYQAIGRSAGHVVGSEYLGDNIAGGHINEQGVRHESATSLTFPDASFDRYLSFDVFEHIPEYSKAFKEAARVLRPGGKLVFTVPFDPGLQAHQIRAQVLPNGEIEHILPPEYHGDPMSQAGVLCFQVFGWDMLDDLKRAGFQTAAAYLYYSRQYGYLGGLPGIFEAVK